MTDALRFVRKAFTVSVVITTIAWSIGLAAFIAPLTAHAATLTAGDLIKASLPAVYYYGADGKRYVFPNEKSYKTWYADFSSVKTITDAELAAVAIGGNATYRPGVKMVKITTDPKVYAVAKGGSLRWVKTEDVAKALYGNDWNKQVDDVPDAFFTNYTVGTDVAAAADYDKAAQQTGSTTINQDKGLSAAGAGVGTGLSVALAPDNPAASTWVVDGANDTASSQGLATALKLRFTASADGAVKVKTLKLKRSGISADSDIKSVHLYSDGVPTPMTRLADYTSIASGVVTFNDATGLFTVAAGKSADVAVRVDLDRNTATGKTLRFALEAAADATTDGAALNGTFPLTSATHETAAVSDFARVQVSGETIPASVDSGTTNKEALRFNFQATGQKVELRGVMFKMVGTASTADITNIKLFDGGTQLGSTVAGLVSDGTAWVDLSASPLVVSAGVTKTLSVNVDVVGGVNRTFEMTVQKESDWVIWDTNYSAYTLPDDSSAIGTYTVLEGASNISINAGTLTMSKSTTSPTGDVVRSATNVEVARFDFKASGEAVKIENIYMFCDVSDIGDGGTGGLDNMKLLVDGVQAGSTADCTEEDEINVNLGSSFIVPGNTTKTLVIKADTYTSAAGAHTAGAVVTVSVRRDDSTSAPGTARGQVSLSSITMTNVTGNSLTFRTGAVTSASNVTLGNYSATNPTGVANAQGTRLASFVLTGGLGEDADITRIRLRDGTTNRNLGEDFQNLRVVRRDTGAQVGTTVGALNTGTTVGNYTYTPSTAIRIKKSEQLVFDVYADVLSTVTNSAVVYTGLDLLDVSATGATTGASGDDSTARPLQQIYIAASGNLTVTADSATPNADHLVLGQTGVELARFRFAADAAEAASVSQVVTTFQFRALGGDVSTVTGTWRNLKVYEAESGALLGTAATLSSASNTLHPYATFSGMSWNIPKGGAKTLVVKADITPFDDGGIASSTWRVEVRENYTSNAASAQADEAVTARGVGSGSDLTGASLDIGATTDSDVRGSAMDVFKSKVTLAHASDAPSGVQSAGAEQTVAKLLVSNTSAGSYTAMLELLNLTITAAGASFTGVSADVNIYKSSVSVANRLATTDDCSATLGCPSSWGGTAGSNKSSITDADFTDTQISAGSSLTLIVTMETNTAGFSANETLTVGVGNQAALQYLQWDDDANDSTGRDYTVSTSLPLTGKTLIY